MDLSNKIKNYRKENDLTQQDLADKLFVSRSLIAKWEQGRGLPTADVLEKLADLLDVSFNELISEKDEKTVAIETNHNIKSQKRFFLLISILSCIMLLTMSAFFVSYINDLNGKNNEDVNSNAKTKIAHAFIYHTAKVDEKNLYINYLGDPFSFDVTFPLNEKDDPSDFRPAVYTRDGKYVPLSFVRSGQKLKSYISYYSTEKDDHYENKLLNFETIFIIDDYMEGDNYIKGFFLSTIPYDGEKAPINKPEFGYEFDNNYNFNGTTISLVTAFPYALFVDGYQGNEFSGLTWCRREYPTKTRDYTTPYGDVYKEGYKIPITLDRNIQTLFVYALDDSQKGFFEYSKLTKEKNSTSLTAKRIQPKFFDETYIDHSFEYELEIIANFTGCSYVIEEWGVNNTPIKTTEGFYLSKIKNQPHSGIFYLDEKTRFIRLIFEDGTLTTAYVVGDHIPVPELQPSGFVTNGPFAIF
ncbi:MAG: helix-turn-helix transcriptional regulator [Clostridia bacterium]|nr:helix-turn-helix transcriptional regulator [Clostridia bacterium]